MIRAQHRAPSTPRNREATVNTTPPTCGSKSLDELLLRVARGDSDSYAELFDAAGALVYGVVKQVVVAPSLAEEVCQEVFSEVWRLAPRFDPGRGAATGWISTIAHRRAVDRVRSEQAHRNRTAHVVRHSHQADYDDVAERVELRMEHDQVRDALSSVSALSREAIEHAFYDGRSYREVAEHLDVPLGTVKSRIRAGLRQMARSLQTTTEGERP